MKKKVFRLLLLGFLFYCVGAVSYTAGKESVKVEPTTPAPQTAQLRQDPEIVAAAQRLGINYAGLNLMYETPPNTQGNPEGVYYAPGTIYLNSSANKTLSVRIVGHEYMHHVQYLHPEEASSFYAYVNQLKNTDDWLFDRMKPYEAPGQCGANCSIQGEIEAIACTEMPDSALNKAFINFCNKWLPQRESLLR